MADRITSPDDDISEEEKIEETPKKTIKYVNAPEDYINPFENYKAGDLYPEVFSDIDFLLKQNPRMFLGFEKLEKEMEQETESKSKIERIWQYTRWKTWKYLESLPKEKVVMTKQDIEKKNALGTVSINGVVYYILKGRQVIVPSDVADMILTSQDQTPLAGQKDLITSINEKLDPETGLPKDPSRLER